MILENKKHFEMLGITKWHNKGYKGQGIKIVNFENVYMLDKFKGKVHTIFPYNETISTNVHGQKTMDVIHQVAPEATKYALTRGTTRFLKDTFPFMISENVDIANASLGGTTSNSDLFANLVENGTILVTSAGNAGVTGSLGGYAQSPNWIAVGAVHNPDNIVRASYSSIGNKLFVMSFSGVYVTDARNQTKSFKQEGTSFSSPTFSGMLGLVQQFFLEKTGRKLNKIEMEKFILDNCIDLGETGHDEYYGNGLFVLPDPDTIDVWEYVKKEEVIIKKPEPETIIPDVPVEEPIPEPEKPVEVVQPMAVKLIIDAGHGGEDTGAYSGGYREKDLTLPVARRTKELLKNWNPAMTRTEDKLLIWNERAALIKDLYDYGISVHFNAGGGSGVEAIHSAFSERGKKLATFLVDEINTQVGIPKRQTPVFSKKNSAGQDYYYMHRLTGRTTTVILEIFFLDNDSDKMFMNIEKISRAIADGFKKFIATQTVFLPPIATNPYTLRKYNSDVHVFEAKPTMQTRVTLGVRYKLETVSAIVANELKQGQKVVAAINCGFFTGASNEHTTLLIANGLYYNPPSINTADFIYYKDGRTEVTNLHGYDQVKLSQLQHDCHFAIGTSYALVINGQKNLMLAEKFSHSTTKQPRTMLGQTADKRMLLVVTDGRVKDSAGLTAVEQAELMLSLGCVNAVNLDGGGSSTMVINRNGVPVVYNELYDGFERSVGSVILVKEA